MVNISASVKLDDKGLQRYIRDKPGEIEKLLDLAGFNIEKKAKRIAEDKHILDTGTLIAAIKSRTPPGEPLTREIGPEDIEYAVFQELGTSKMPARPFMVPALESERKPFLDAVSETLKKV